MFHETMPALGHALAAVTHSTVANLFAVQRGFNSLAARQAGFLTHSCPRFQHLLSERLTYLGIMGAPLDHNLFRPQNVSYLL